MNITIKSTRIIKEGTQKNGTPYKWVSVMAEDGSPKGTEYTSFDASILKQISGAVIDIGDPIIKEGKLSFKEVVSVVSEGTPLAPDTSRPSMTPDLWAEKDRVTRKSIEDQTRAKIIAELMIADKASEHLIGKLETYLDQLGDYPAGKPTLRISPDRIEATRSHIDEPTSSNLPDEQIPTNIQQFFNKLQSFGKQYTRSWFLTTSGFKEADLLNPEGVKKAYDWVLKSSEDKKEG